MKLKYELYEIDKKEKKAGESKSFEFRPTKEAFRDGVVFKVKGPNSETIMETLDLPTTVGDIIEIEPKLSEKQTELPGKGENGKKKGRTASTD